MYEKRPLPRPNLSLTRLLLRLGLGELLIEAIDAAVVGDEALLTGVERVAIRAGINLDFFKGGSGFEGRAAGHAGHGAFVISGVDVFLHF